jgi:predicted transcriptional regulator
MTTTVRISATAHEILKEESRATGRSMQAVLEDAIEHFRRRRFIADVNAAYSRVREDEQAWREVLNEREAWESTIDDGLNDDES